MSENKKAKRVSSNSGKSEAPKGGSAPKGGISSAKSNVNYLCSFCGSAEHEYKIPGDCPVENHRNYLKRLNFGGCAYCGGKDHSFYEPGDCALEQKIRETRKVAKLSSESEENERQAVRCQFCHQPGHDATIMPGCPRERDARLMLTGHPSAKDRSNVRKEDKELVAKIQAAADAACFDADQPGFYVGDVFVPEPSFKTPPSKAPQEEVPAVPARKESKRPKRVRSRKAPKKSAPVVAAIADMAAQLAGANDAVKEVRAEVAEQLATPDEPTAVEKALQKVTDSHDISEGTIDIHLNRTEELVERSIESFKGRSYFVTSDSSSEELVDLPAVRSIVKGLAVLTSAATTSVGLLGIGVVRALFSPVTSIASFIGSVTPNSLAETRPVAFSSLALRLGRVAAYVSIPLAASALMYYTYWKFSAFYSRYVPKRDVAIVHKYEVQEDDPIHLDDQDVRADISSLAEIKHADPQNVVVEVEKETVGWQPRYAGRDFVVEAVKFGASKVVEFVTGTPVEVGDVGCVCKDYEITCQCGLMLRTAVVDTSEEEPFVASFELVSQLLAGKNHDPDKNLRQMFEDFRSSAARCHTVNINRYENVDSRTVMGSAMLSAVIGQHVARRSKRQFPIGGAPPPPK